MKSDIHFLCIDKRFKIEDKVYIILENGSEVTVTKDYPIVGANKAAGWQVFDIDVFIKTKFEGGRHKKRVRKI